jgi:SAM-dependent methyltransferase
MSGPRAIQGNWAQPTKRVLNAGSGPRSNRQLHSVFTGAAWCDVRLDVDSQADPDLVGSIVDMAAFVPTGSFDAVWSSHSLEHLYAHEVPLALSEFLRILKPDGFALITSPDLEAVATIMLEHGLDHTAYLSPVGPITPHDMLFGHSASVARGNTYMAHKTGFTCAALGQRLVDVGFPMVLVKRDKLDLWALAFKENADKLAIQRELKSYGLDMFGEPE